MSQAGVEYGDAEQPHGASFIGRTAEMVQLEAGLAQAAAGRGRLFLLTGEPGIGKTRLASEIAERAAARGFDVLWGRCWEEDGAPNYWPWIQALRTLAESRDCEGLARIVGNAAPMIAAVVPELLAPGAGAPDADEGGTVPSLVESERARFGLFDAVTGLVCRAAAEQPLLILLDDLHSADLPSLRLLQFIARALPNMPAMIVATQREADIRFVQHGQEAFTALERHGERCALRGWSRDDVLRYVQRFLANPPERLVEVIHAATRGNPLFVDGVVRAVRDHPDVELHDGYPFGLRLPDGVRDVIRERLRRLPGDVRGILTAAAAIGVRFDLRVLAAVVEQPREQLVTWLQAAIDADILLHASPGVLAHAFAHPLVRDAVCAEVEPAERLRLHRRIAEAFRAVFAEGLEEHASEIAHHYLEAGMPEDVALGIEFACRAARRAMRQFAYEGAVRLYQRALGALDRGAADEELRCDLMVALGEAQLRAGNAARARQICGEAALIARRLGLGEQLARAALTFGGIPIGPGILDPEQIGLLAESRRFLGPEPTALRAIVCARLAVRLHTPVDNSQRAALCREALEAARLSDSDEALVYALDARHLVFWSQTDLPGQLMIADQIMEAAERCGNRELLLHSHQLRINDYLEMGAIDAVDLEIDLYERLAAELRQDLYIFRTRLFRAMRAMVDGDFERAERIAREAHALGDSIQSFAAATYFGVQMLALERLRGGPGETESNMLALLEAYPSVSALRIGLAALYADLGRRDDAAAALERVAPDDLDTIPMDNNWLVGAALTADVCAYLGDRRRGATVFEMILPFAGRNAVGGSGAACNGSVSRQLGQLAAMHGRPAEAFEFLQDAIRRDAKMGARPFVLRAKFDLASLLASEAGADAALVVEPRAQARELADEVCRGATKLGMQRLAQRAAELNRTFTVSRSVPIASTLEATFCREGDYWKVSFGDEVAHLKHLRGFDYLVRLISAPGIEIACVDLASDGAGTAGEGNFGPLLDARAKSAYRTRLGELQAEIDEAEAFHDPPRAERARREQDALESELRRAVGLGGRDRASGSAAERARVTVAKSIRLALRRIAEHAPGLGRHLDATVRTGIACSYRPDPHSPLRWRTGADSVSPSEDPPRP